MRKPDGLRGNKARKGYVCLTHEQANSNIPQPASSRTSYSQDFSDWQKENLNQVSLQAVGFSDTG